MVVRGACFAALARAHPLGSVLYYVVVRGIGGISLDFFTELPKPVGESGGGMAQRHRRHACSSWGSLACSAIPPGVLAGVYLAEFGNTRFGRRHAASARTS